MKEILRFRSYECHCAQYVFSTKRSHTRESQLAREKIVKTKDNIEPRNLCVCCDLKIAAEGTFFWSDCHLFFLGQTMTSAAQRRLYYLCKFNTNLRCALASCKESGLYRFAPPHAHVSSLLFTQPMESEL